MAKEISNRFIGLMEDENVKLILDKTSNIKPVIDKVSAWWSYDLFNRKPGPAYMEDGTFVGTDLDMACFLYELCQRGAAINIPEYKSFRQTKVKEGQMLTSKENRHGILKALISNKETWVFSARIEDQNVMTSEGTGESRTFSFTNFKGDWYDGWKELQFISNAKENEWLKENKILTKNKIVFSEFIHPNRWTSFFGVKYFITKLLIERMTEEAKHYNKEHQRMWDEGIRYPISGSDTTAITPKSFPTSDKGKQISVDAFEVELDVPGNDTKFPVYESTAENLQWLYRERVKFIYILGPKLRFMTRATEYAHYNKPDAFPGWIKGAKWDRGYKQKGKRKLWDRLIICQPINFEIGVALRKRQWSKSTRVTEDF